MHGAVVQYSDRSLFEADLYSSTSFDFEYFPAGITVEYGDTVPFGEAIVGSTFNTGVFSTGLFGAPSVQVGSLNRGGLYVSLLPGHNAIGMDIGALLGPSTFSYRLALSSGPDVLGSIAVSDNDDLGLPGGTFFGYVSDSAEIVRLQFQGAELDFEVIDNLTYGTTIPEPTCGVLSLLALVVIGRRRRS